MARNSKTLERKTVLAQTHTVLKHGFKSTKPTIKTSEGPSKMNKNTAIYTVAAILAGFTIMMIPLALETGSPSFMPRFAFTDEMRKAPTPEDNILEMYGLTSKPTNLLPASLVFLVGLAAATGAYVTLKKKSS